MESVPYWMEGVPFTLPEGRDAGLSDAVMRRRQFERPFHGVRVTAGSGRHSDELADRCAALRVALSRDAVFSHATAARLYGMPLPPWIDERLHVLVPGGGAVRRPGVIGWKRAADLSFAASLHSLPVTSPADTWVTLAAMTGRRGGKLSREWLVAIADFIVSGHRTRYGREPALATLDDLTAALARHGSGRGATGLAWALERVRAPVDSPPETFLRLGLVRARLPEPKVQPTIVTSAGPRHPDLAYLEERVVMEYLGDVHRTDRATWLKDLQRVQLFEDAAYRVILVGGDDLSPTGMPALCARVRRALRRP